MGQLVQRRRRAALARSMPAPLKLLTNEVVVTRDDSRWAVLVMHTTDDAGSPVKLRADSMVANFGAKSANVAWLPVVVVEPFLADTTPLLNGAALLNALVLVSRGGIPFVEKAYRVQECGAAGVIFVNTDDQPFCPMSEEDTVHIPIVCVGKSVGQQWVERADAGAKASLMFGATSGTGSPTLGSRATARKLAAALPGHRGLL